MPRRLASQCTSRCSIDVRTKPGQTRFTWIQCGAISRASAWVRAAIANLLTE
jgi:hypothetical protein